MLIRTILYDHPGGDIISTWEMEVVGPSKDVLRERIRAAVYTIYAKCAKEVPDKLTYRYLRGEEKT